MFSYHMIAPVLDEERVKKLDADFKKFEEYTDKVPITDNADYREVLANLRSQRDRLQQQLEQVGTAGEERLEDLKLEIKDTWENLRNKLDEETQKLESKQE